MTEENFFIESVTQNVSDMLHRVIGNTFIVEYGIIKAIPAEGVVTVITSVAESAGDTVITDCVLASIASSSFTVRVKPNIDDKVIVLFPRKFNNDMFQKEKNEPIIATGGTGYNVLTGIAILLNQYQEATHKNYLDISDGCITLKLAYSKDDEKNFFELTTDNKGGFVLKNNEATTSLNSDGEFSFTSGDFSVTTNKDNEITVENGKATITIDKNGNVTVDAQGKYTIKNGTTDLKQVVDGLAQELENLTTVGSPSTQATSPASKGTIATWRQSKLNQLFN